MAQAVFYSISHKTPARQNKFSLFVSLALSWLDLDVSLNTHPRRKLNFRRICADYQLIALSLTILIQTNRTIRDDVGRL